MKLLRASTAQTQGVVATVSRSARSRAQDRRGGGAGRAVHLSKPNPRRPGHLTVARFAAQLTYQLMYLPQPGGPIGSPLAMSPPSVLTGIGPLISVAPSATSFCCSQRLSAVRHGCTPTQCYGGRAVEHAADSTGAAVSPADRLLAGPAIVSLAGWAALNHRAEHNRLGQLVAGDGTGRMLDQFALVGLSTFG
ncbi:lipid-transfer domain protein [Mycobacterium xenopi 3993]|nr:lipid-transfer domain protein [Mycobacterium xenopi 3993]